MSAFWRQGGILTPGLWQEVGQEVEVPVATVATLKKGLEVEVPLVEGLPWEDMPLTTWCQLPAREMAQRTADWISAIVARRHPSPS